MSQSVGQLVMLVALFGLMWFMLIRPQQLHQKRRQEMLNSLKKGDRVVTIGGIHGQIVDLTPDTARLRIAPDVEITIARSAVGAVQKSDNAE